MQPGPELKDKPRQINHYHVLRQFAEVQANQGAQLHKVLFKILFAHLGQVLSQEELVAEIIRQKSSESINLINLGAARNRLNRALQPRLASHHPIVVGSKSEGWYLNCPEAQKDRVIELYAADQLLCRAMDPIRFVFDEERRQQADLEVWEYEVKELKGAEGLKKLSTTLLVKGKPVSTYGPKGGYGFLFDATKSGILHVSDVDIGTGDPDEVPPNFATLSELADSIRQQQGQFISINEVNINCRIEALAGLFVVKGQLLSSDNLIKIHFVALFLRKFGVRVPIFVYNAVRGEIAPIQLTQEELDQEIKKLPEDRQPMFASALSKLILLTLP